MRFVRMILGYVAAVTVAALIIQGWQMEVYRKPWPVQLVWVQMAVIMTPVGIAFTAIPAFVLRATALIWNVFNPPVAALGGGVTGTLVYWLINTDGERLDVVAADLAVFLIAGVSAGLVWYSIEARGAVRR